MDIRQLEGRSPEQMLLFAARQAESKGLKSEARRIRVIARALMKDAAADPDIALDSWDEFSTWFDKNRSQGLEFTFEDIYGSDSEEAKQIKVLLEGYDMLERRKHEFYLLLKNEQPQFDEGPAPEDTLDEEPTEDVTEETTDEVSEDEAISDDDAAEALEEGGEEETSDEDAAAEEALAPEGEEDITESSYVTPESKTIASLTKSLKNAKVKVEHIAFRGDGCYRIACAGNDTVPTASNFLKRAGMPFKTVEHPTGRIFIDVQMLPLG